MARASSPPRKPQPDFQALFFEHFGARPKRHTYELRFGTSNLHHDNFFLSSLLHDARLSRGSVRRRGRSVVIDLQRDTWEVGRGAPMHVLASRLTASGVDQVKWRFTGAIPDEEQEIWMIHTALESARIPGDYWFALVGPDWQVRFLLRSDRARVVLRDVGTPTLQEASVVDE